MRKILLTRFLHKSPKAALKLRTVKRYLRSKHKEFSDRRGHRMAVFANDFIGAKIYTEGIYEKEEIQDLIEVMKILKIDLEKSTALDIGANIGNHAIEFSKFFHRVEAFEPNPHTFKLLSFNCDYTPNVTAHNFGLGDKNCVLELSESQTNFGGASAVYDRGTENKIEIEVKRLDEIRDQLSDVKLIKIDVEGMELQVLKGAEQLITKFKPIICFEQHISDFNENGEEPDTIRHLRTKGYRIFWTETGQIGGPLLARKLVNTFNALIRRREIRSIVTGEKVPRRFHSMLIAIHKEENNPAL